VDLPEIAGFRRCADASRGRSSPRKRLLPHYERTISDGDAQIRRVRNRRITVASEVPARFGERRGASRRCGARLSAGAAARSTHTIQHTSAVTCASCAGASRAISVAAYIIPSRAAWLPAGACAKGWDTAAAGLGQTPRYQVAHSIRTACSSGTARIARMIHMPPGWRRVMVFTSAAAVDCSRRPRQTRGIHPPLRHPGEYGVILARISRGRVPEVPRTCSGNRVQRWRRHPGRLQMRLVDRPRALNQDHLRTYSTGDTLVWARGLSTNLICKRAGMTPQRCTAISRTSSVLQELGRRLMRAQDYAVFAWMAEGVNSSSLAAAVESNRRLQTEVNTLRGANQRHVDHARDACVPLLHAVRIESRDLVARRLAKALQPQYPNFRTALLQPRALDGSMYAAPRWPSRRRRRKHKSLRKCAGCVFCTTRSCASAEPALPHRLEARDARRKPAVPRWNGDPTISTRANLGVAVEIVAHSAATASCAAMIDPRRVGTTPKPLLFREIHVLVAVATRQARHLQAIDQIASRFGLLRGRLVRERQSLKKDTRGQKPGRTMSRGVRSSDGLLVWEKNPERAMTLLMGGRTTSKRGVLYEDPSAGAACVRATGCKRRQFRCSVVADAGADRSLRRPLRRRAGAGTAPNEDFALQEVSSRVPPRGLRSGSSDQHYRGLRCRAGTKGIEDIAGLAHSMAGVNYTDRGPFAASTAAR